MKRQTLSIAIATFNEEKNLPICFDSVKDIADEFVVVDGESKDRTVEVAKRYTQKIKVTTNKPVFHVNKQMAIDMATSDWVLQMDADETVSEELKKEIVSILKSKKTADGYWIPRKNWFIGRFLMKGGQYPDYTLRLYRNGKGKLPQKDVHEQAVIDGEVGYLKNPLLHYPYEDFSSYIRKWNRYNNLLATQIKDQLEGKSFLLKGFSAIDYLLIKPIFWFLITYIRHKGFTDSWQGFVFSFFSSVRFQVSYIKFLLL